MQWRVTTSVRFEIIATAWQGRERGARERGQIEIVCVGARVAEKSLRKLARENIQFVRRAYLS